MVYDRRVFKSRISLNRLIGGVRWSIQWHEALPGMVFERFRESLKAIMPGSLSAVDRIPGIDEVRDWIYWW